MNSTLNDLDAEGWNGLEPAAKPLMFWFGLLPFLIPIAPATVVPLALMPGWQADDFIRHGIAWPSARALFWIFVQAAGSLFAVTMMVRGYQATEASRAAVLEYVLLPVSALWGLVLWAEVPGAMALIGMALIVAAGVVVVRNSEA